MNYNFKKISAKFFLLSIITSLLLSLNFVTTSQPVLAVDGGLTCDSLKSKKAIKDYIITVMETRINPPGQAGESDAKSKNQSTEGVINCIRKTTCEAKDCSKQLYVAPGNCKPITPDKDGNGVYCQPVQILYAQSGTGLIYTYIGLIYRWAAGTAGIATVLYLTLAGVQMATSEGDSARYEKAKDHATNSIAGLVLLFLSALLLYTINPNFFIK